MESTFSGFHMVGVKKPAHVRSINCWWKSAFPENWLLITTPTIVSLPFPTDCENTFEVMQGRQKTINSLFLLAPVRPQANAKRRQEKIFTRLCFSKWKNNRRMCGAVKKLNFNWFWTNTEGGIIVIFAAFLPRRRRASSGMSIGSGAGSLMLSSTVVPESYR